MTGSPGTFSLTLHAWDEATETLLALGTQGIAQLRMPRLGEALEPAHADTVKPWWRAFATPPAARASAAEAPPLTLPEAMRWPLD